MAAPVKSTSITIYRTRICVYCVMAARLLTGKGIKFDEIYLDNKPEERAELVRRTNRMTVPQIFIGDTFIGGFDELAQLDRDGRLDAMLAGGQL